MIWHYLKMKWTFYFVYFANKLLIIFMARNYRNNAENNHMR